MKVIFLQVSQFSLNVLVGSMKNQAIDNSVEVDQYSNLYSLLTLSYSIFLSKLGNWS